MGESIFACSLSKALYQLRPKITKSIRDQWMSAIFAKHGLSESLYHHTFTHFVQSYPAVVQELQKKFKMAWLVVKTFQEEGKNKKRHELLYDGRHAIVDNSPNTPEPLRCLWFGKDDRIIMDTDQIQRLPLLAETSYRRKQLRSSQPLWKLLGYSTPSQEMKTQNSPNNRVQLKEYIQQFRQPDTKVVVRFATGLKQKSLVVDWIQDPPAHMQTNALNRTIYILAFTNRHYQLTFTQELEPGLERDRAKGQNMCRQWDQYQQQWEKWKQNEQAQGGANAHQANCASAVSVQHGGLNLAYDLGVISIEEQHHYSTLLGQTYPALYLFLDPQHHVRHITYYDTKTTFCQEMKCFEDQIPSNPSSKVKQKQEREELRRTETVDAMMTFWQQVWKRREYWVQQRQTILQPILDRLEGLLSGIGLSQSQRATKRRTSGQSSQISSPLLKCLNELKSIITRHRLYLYSKEDSHLHSIKFYLVHFAYQQLKSCRGLFIKAHSDDTLMKISIPGLTVINLYGYLSCKRDLDFFATLAQPWKGPQPSDVFLSHSIQQLKTQKVTMDSETSMTASSYCRQYGWMFARHIFRYWSNFGQYLLTTFGYDIQGQTTLPSASYLAFQCVWTQYIKKAGPMAHGLERCKPHYEDLLRQQSRGGFMFSIRDSLQQGQPLENSTPHQVASSIAEFDLVSAYGFGASQAHIPAGFCVGYEKLARDQDAHWLERLDPKLRHKSFEFRAVYKTIDKMMRRQGIPIRSVYHNFSPLGLFTLGKYNLDLVIVREDGRLLLVNMDGRWIHGCDECPSTGTFAHGQSHQQVRAKSIKRDDEIRAWVATVNANSSRLGGLSDWMDYIVVHDCHSPGFTVKDLDRDFATEPTLKALVQGYHLTDQLGIEVAIDQLQARLFSKMSNVSFTYVLKADVTIEPEEKEWHPQMDLDGSATMGPLIVYDQDKQPLTDPVGHANYHTLDRRSKRNSTLQRLGWEGQVVLTRDYVEWLQKTYGQQFYLRDVDWILFYKTEPIINDIYRQLVDLRSTTADPVLVTFIKKLVNLSAGFYGSRSTPLANKTTYRLVNKAPWNFAFFRHTLETHQSVDLGQSSYYLLETKPWPKVDAVRQPSKSAIPLFLTIVEYGKLRLVQMLHFLRVHLERGSFRLLYSNIDNVILAFANGASCLDEAVRPDQQESFSSSRSLYFVPNEEPLVKSPGLAECKWSRHNPPWKFTTLRTQHYCFSSSDPQQNLYKASGWSDVTTEQVQEWTEQLLGGKRVAIPQKRRTNKKLHLDTKDVVLHF